MTSPTTQLTTVAIRRIVVGDIRAVIRPANFRMQIVPEDGSTGAIAVPYSPNEVSHSNIGADYGKVNRASRTDALIYLNEQLPVMSFDLLVADKVQRKDQNGNLVTLSAMGTITALQQFAKLGTRLKVIYGSLESGTWRITSLQVSSARRDAFNNEITQASVSLEFTRVSDIIIGVGPVTGGVQPPPQTTPPAGSQPRTYTVKKGDTLWAISVKFYGTGSKWTQIADANGIKDPKTLQIGKVLRIP